MKSNSADIIIDSSNTDANTNHNKDNKVINNDHDILVRAASGEKVSRPPVWLMRQAGRYMAAFREYSNKYPFRQRSETPDIAIELSLQPWKAFDTDGVIMFSDILTPLPGMGIEFDVVKGKGPIIENPIRTRQAIDDLRIIDEEILETRFQFLAKILNSLQKETKEKTSLIGFVGAPFTLAAYSIEGASSKHCMHIKQMFMHEPEIAEIFLNKLAISIGNYANFQIENGAQVIQIFESWAHQLSPLQFELYAKPYANIVTSIIKNKHPHIPVIYYGNGASSYLEKQNNMEADMIGIDWHIDMAQARTILGKAIPISGNVDPTVLLGKDSDIVNAVEQCIEKAGAGKEGYGSHVFNLGHGVMQEAPEEKVGLLIQSVKTLGEKLYK